MNETPEPITGQGVLWAIGQINQRFGRALARGGPGEEVTLTLEEIAEAERKANET